RRDPRRGGAQDAGAIMSLASQSWASRSSRPPPVSWNLSTVVLRYPANIPGITGHHWSAGIAMATPIAHKASTAGAKAQALTALDLLLNPDLLKAAVEAAHPRGAVAPIKMEEFCRRWNVIEFAFFGSVLRKDFGPESDVDALVTFAPDAHWTLFDVVPMQDELQELLGRPVDLVERKAIERSENYIRRRHIFQNLETVYVVSPEC
ncbi:MAG: nucleotidyltransferase domain-containing protein, partial [Planctomycetota bacterium]